MNPENSPHSVLPSIWLRTICARRGLGLTDLQLAALDRFASLLLGWNKRVNLISRKDEENLWTYHILHSISILFRVEIPTGLRVLDLGTGGGLPGIPLAIVRKDLTFTLLDATKKKVDAVANMVSQLGLTNVTTVWGRAEDVGLKPGQYQQYDIVVARAVGSLKDLAKCSHPFLRLPPTDQSSDSRGTHGRIIFRHGLLTLKGGDLEAEIRQVKQVKSVTRITTLPLELAEVDGLLASDKKILVVEF